MKDQKSNNVFSVSPVTLDEVLAKLTSAYHEGIRVRLFLGDNVTGVDWCEAHDVTGRIGRSTGTTPCPLLIANARSVGGGAILTANIVKLVNIETGAVLYQHRGYTAPRFSMDAMKDDSGLNRVYRMNEDGTSTHVASFHSIDSGQRYIAFMTGQRHTKGGRITNKAEFTSC